MPPTSDRSLLANWNSKKKFSFGRHWRGRRGEVQVAAYLQKLGYVVVTANLRLIFAEVDLLCLSPIGELVAVEVKSVTEDLAWQRLVKREQIQRQRKVFAHLLSSSVRPVRMHLAAVNQHGQVQIFEDYLSEAGV